MNVDTRRGMLRRGVLRACMYACMLTRGVLRVCMYACIYACMLIQGVAYVACMCIC